MVAAGVALTAGSDPLYRLDLDTSAIEHFVEVVLAVVLFVDATEVEGGFFGKEPKITARLLLIALPLSLVLAVAFGALTFPHAQLLDPRGHRDGGHADRPGTGGRPGPGPPDPRPACATCSTSRAASTTASSRRCSSSPSRPLTPPPTSPHRTWRPSSRPCRRSSSRSGRASAVGFGGGWLITRAYAAGWTEPPALRIAVLTLPLLSYLVAVGLKGNGFVAAFVAGLLFRRAAKLLPHDALHLVEDTGVLLGLLVWFLFGQLINQTLDDGTDWAIVLFAVLAVVVARTVPVVLSLARTNIERADRLFLGWVSPRGLASIAFGLLAYIELDPRRTSSSARSWS